MGRVDGEATAFGPRPQYLVGVEANWEAGDDAANIAWARETVANLGRFSSGGSYLNFPGFFEEGDDLRRTSHGERNFERLQEIRRRYDPASLFARPE